MIASHEMGIPTRDYGNDIRRIAREEGFEKAFSFPGFVPVCIRPLFCRGIEPFRWATLARLLPVPQPLRNPGAAVEK